MNLNFKNKDKIKGGDGVNGSHVSSTIRILIKF